jgi:hypothetical protein
VCIVASNRDLKIQDIVRQDTFIPICNCWCLCLNINITTITKHEAIKTSKPSPKVGPEFDWQEIAFNPSESLNVRGWMFTPVPEKVQLGRWFTFVHTFDKGEPVRDVPNMF